jgi:adenine-specific DNA-methyltransferase
VAVLETPPREPEELASVAAGGSEGEAPRPFRPVQFLVNKTRALPALLAVAELELQPRDRIADVFCGSTVVAQGLARAGHRVAAFDALAHCVHFARALLGVGRDSELDPTARSLPEANVGWVGPWRRWLETEDAAVRENDSETLIRLTATLPQIWRRAGASADLHGLFEGLQSGVPNPDGIVAAHYAGSYFGLRQAIEIDLLRRRIEEARIANLLSPWQESVMLTALLSAASECAFSAGKHYAQPHRIRDGKDLAFIRRRIVEDRRKPLFNLFVDRLHLVATVAQEPGGHTATAMAIEDILKEPDALGKIAAIYADPPYTAQQYSRFYHVPEVISAYQVPILQRVHGRVTRGLYPASRHKSRFCSRRHAPAALADVCRLAAERGASLLLSYSYSRTGETGNKRSIEVEQLRSILARHFEDVAERELDVAYRQFNAASVSIDDRSDAEVLFVGRNRA